MASPDFRKVQQFKGYGLWCLHIKNISLEVLRKSERLMPLTGVFNVLVIIYQMAQGPRRGHTMVTAGLTRGWIVSSKPSTSKGSHMTIDDANRLPCPLLCDPFGVGCQ